MKMISMILFLFSTLFSSVIQAEIKPANEMILKKDLAVEAGATKHFGKKNIYNSSCALIVENRTGQDLKIAKDSVLIVEKVISGVKKIDPGYPESEAITHIIFQSRDEELENVLLSLSCESGIFYTKDEAYMSYVSPQKVLKKFNDFIVQSK